MWARTGQRVAPSHHTRGRVSARERERGGDLIDLGEFILGADEVSTPLARAWKRRVQRRPSADSLR